MENMDKGLTVPKWVLIRDVDGISRDHKILGLNNPGILKLEKSRNKKSRDFGCIKIPGFLNESWDIPAGFFPLFF
jgi:hypothetical protein